MSLNSATTNLSASLKAKAELERRRRLRSAPTHAFHATYRDDPVAFVHDCFLWHTGDTPAPYQEEILAALVSHQRVSARGPHGLGKSAVASWALLWFALTRDGQTDWKAPVTASVWRQVTKFLFPELRKWARVLNWSVIGREPFSQILELQALNLKLKTGEAFAVVSDDPASIEGAHATEVFYVFDEAKAIPAGTFDAAEGAFSNAGTDTAANAYALAISTPGDTGGRFYDIHKRRPGYEDWWVKHVTLEDAIAAGRISREWADQRKRQWGETSPVYLNRVLGEFAEAGTDTLIPLAWVEAAHERWLACDGKGAGQTTYGVDVARFGDDQTVIVRLVGKVVEKIDYQSQQDTMATTGQVILRVGIDNKKTPIMVDVIGIGAGVVDRLREQGFAVQGVNVGEAAKDHRGDDLKDSSNELAFMNLRSWGWWLLRDRLDPNGSDPLALPADDMLTGDLTAPKWKVTSAGRIQVESKDDIRKRIGRSTDAADGVMLACLQEKLFGTRKRRSATW